MASDDPIRTADKKIFVLKAAFIVAVIALVVIAILTFMKLNESKPDFQGSLRVPPAERSVAFSN